MINSRHFSFNVVNMPNGDVRLFVSVYNGYADADVQIFGITQAEADARGMQWGCAWTRVHAITLTPACTCMQLRHTNDCAVSLARKAARAVTH